MNVPVSPRPPTPHVTPPSPLRWLWITAGWLCVGLGAAGLAVPLLPTTPFLLLAAACFARGSERFLAWLIAHRVFGPTIHAWRERRALPPGVKGKAIALMVVTMAVSAWLLPHPAGRIGTGIICAGLVVFLARLPVWDGDTP